MRIVRTPRYLKDLRRIGATGQDVSSVEETIAANPSAGDVIPGMRGVRKVRFRLGSSGKRGGGRAIYYLVALDQVAIMIFAYSKSRQDDLTSEQRRFALSLVEALENEEDRGR